MANIGFISLGCAKNQVDCERMMYRVKDAGYDVCGGVDGCDVVVINTCGFIDSAKSEAIENILTMGALKAEGRIGKILVTGCLSQRYQQTILDEMPEVDGVLGTGSYTQIVPAIEALLRGEKVFDFGSIDAPEEETGRIVTTPEHYAFLKIAEGCDNRCAYCIIPYFRGKFRSRQMDDVLYEARLLADSGVKELIVVAQDTSRYGTDLGDGKRLLPQLLRQLCAIEDFTWVRLHYLYPDEIDHELIDVIAREPKIVKYLDIPLQHVDGEVLRRMNRRGNAERIAELIEKIRKTVPDVTIRTTFITGFPGETEEQFSTLHQFIKDIRFERLGCFTYSPEEDTPAANFEGQVDEQTKHDRMERIMDSQMQISAEKNEEKIGKVAEVLVEGYDDYLKCYFGRTGADAPEVDGKIFFLATRPLVFGEFVKVQINDSIEYDLLGEMCDESAK